MGSPLETYAQTATESIFTIAGAPWKSIGRDKQEFSSPSSTGTRWALVAMDGQPIRSWDSRGNAFRSTYDGLRRGESTYIDEGSGEYRHTHVIYGTDYDDGSGTPDPAAVRLLGRAWEVYDASGKSQTVVVDDDGNVEQQTKWFVAGYRTLPDWTTLSGTGAPDLVLDPRDTSNAEVYVMGATWDALGRPKTESLYRGTRTSEDSTKSYTYDAGGRLYSVVASCAGQADETILRSVTYNARGQRLVVERGTKAGTSPATPSLTTRYLYDSNTFRILRIYTERDTSGGVSVLQDLRYVHDAVGNITHRFNAHDSTVWYSNAPVTPHQYFWYDALDRLVQARGRENDTTFHLSEGGFGVRRQKNVPYGRGPHAHPNDASALRRYTQVYNYDAVGNLALVKHHLGDLGTVLAVRTYRYTNNSGSVVDGAYAEPFTPLFNNQLAATVVDGTTYSYGYDEHGNMDLPHLVAQSWSPLNRLHSIQATAAWSADGDSPTPMGTTEDHDWFYVYGADGQRARKVRASGATGAVRSEERFYLGEFEVWREYVSGSHASATSAGTPETERETWHVSDDKGRLAMGETKTWSGGAVVSSLVPRWRLQLGDHLHTAVAEVTEAGAIISYEEYHPYGTTAFQSVSGVDVSRKRYRYTGMERDDETGLHYHRHRYYAPWLGRWTRPDPAGLVDGVGRYSYARQRPTCGSDLAGLQMSYTDLDGPGWSTTDFMTRGLYLDWERPRPPSAPWIPQDDGWWSTSVQWSNDLLASMDAAKCISA